MKIVFFGTPEFAVPSLEALVHSGENVVACVPQPDRPVGRGRKLSQPPVKVAAMKAGIPVIQPASLRDEEFSSQLRNLAPDLCVVVAYGKFFPKELLDLPPHGWINVHASLLPRYRGAAPIQWSIIRGDDVTGVTTIYINEEMDGGDMLLQKETPIQENETSGDLHDRLSHLGAETLKETLANLKKGDLEGVPQDESQVTFAPMLKKEDGRVQWSRPAREVVNHIRGVSPWPGAFTVAKEERLKILEASVTPDGFASSRRKTPGSVFCQDETDIFVEVSDGWVALGKVQLPGKRVMTASEFLHGNQLPDVLGE